MPNPTPTRERIVEATLRIIGQDGVAAVTNRRIAKEAGVSLGSITYHFATQHDLLRESLRSFVDQETRRFTDLAAHHITDCVTAEQAATIVGQVSADTVFDSEHIAPFELYIHAGRDPQLRPAAAECFTAYDQLATSILGGLGVPDPERLAGPVVALVVGLQLRRLATGSASDDLVTALLLLTGASPPGP
ncbi:TetR/AcrR family transcriptional regulator [Streptomyces sp. H39-S7]|uniref:TetR/AcrR family transcriptional regulator n=1 Tax=Streptomyces sp. H39-S7 TaxID=3004357 RepID=UPI0022AEC074|nr:TetR/AcrR family transcriptional regulator [Streptomyces sp. H39-S7]MCZ4124667.1 TetR family transcriptional regulator [Streptomyces sp. H39-S7]